MKNKMIIQSLLALLLISNFTLTSAQNLAQNPVQSLDQLLERVRHSKQLDDQVNRQRETAFLAQKKQQKSQLKDANKSLKKRELKSEKLELLFGDNEKLLVNKRAQMRQRMGKLQELFGHLTAASGDFSDKIESSIISAQYPGRERVFEQLIDTMENATLLPTVAEIETLWFEMLREMTESAKVVRFEAEVIQPNGLSRLQQVVRIGTFNLLSDNKYLSYSAEANSISELARQPASNFTHAIAKLQRATENPTRIGIDPTGPSGGRYLSALVDTPNFSERWHQGGIVGYIISAIGAVTGLIVLWRLVVLSVMESRIVTQLKSRKLESKPTQENALSRVLSIHVKQPQLDADTLEVKLSEAILKERPAIEQSLPLLKIVAMVAPLLGLLGTVAGMILTFQAITIYGAGDPKTMASGISSALVTTVLGLLVAIPTVFAHAFLTGKAQNILHILEQQSMGLIARHTEVQIKQNA